MSAKRVPLYNVISGEDENIFFEGKPNKTAYVLNSCKEGFPKFLADIFFKLVLCPFLFLNVANTLPLITQIVIVVLWVLYLIPTFKMLQTPFQKIAEYKNTYYIVTNKAIYIQFGINQIYYRIYPNDRIGTRVFYRQNRIDNIFGVGTLGFSVDDYYEERLVSVEDYESLYNVLKEVTNSKREELERIQAEREAKKREFEEQAKLIAQEQLFIQQQEEEEEKKRRERYERETREYFEREQASHERLLREREERQARELERRRMMLEEDDDDDEDDDEDRNERFNELRQRRRMAEMQQEEEKEEEEENNNDTDTLDSFDMDGVETEERKPSEKVVENYRNRYSSNSSLTRRKSASRRFEKKSIKNSSNEERQNNKINNSLDLNRLWSENNEDE